MKVIRTVRFIALFLFGVSVGIAQPPRVMDSAELHLALKKLNIVGSALFVAAHPDDENTALLSYLAKGRLVRAAYLSVTRGEGGQNLIGSEQGDLLGIIRTQELLAARRIDGAEQYFTRAIDFGYSKTSEETIRIWGHEQVLADVVWIIRKFRPDVLITRFSPTLGGHGNHTASALLAEEAFHAAGDTTKFPEQLKYVQPWQPKRIVFNTSRFLTEQIDTAKALKVDIGEYSPLLGRSFTEIAGISRSMHKSQGFGAAQSRGSNINYLNHTAGDPAKSDLFDGIDLSWDRIKNGKRVSVLLEEAIRKFKPHDPAATIPLLLKALGEMRKLPADPLVQQKQKELIEVVKSCSGFWLEANASEFSVTPGSSVRVLLNAINRSSFPVSIERIEWPFGSKDTLVNQKLADNKLYQLSTDVVISKSQTLSQPYWLVREPRLGMYNVADQEEVGDAENDAPVIVKASVLLGGERIVVDLPVRYRWVDPVEGELYRPLEITPAVAINLREQVLVYQDEGTKSLNVTLRSGKVNVQGTVRAIVPAGWQVQPNDIPFNLLKKNEEQIVTFTIWPVRRTLAPASHPSGWEGGPGRDASSGDVKIEATTDGGSWSFGMTTIRYNHIPPQTVFPTAKARLVRVDLKKKGETIGYIMGSGDEVPTLLQQVGYSVTLLSDEDIALKDLSKFDAIVAGVRLYNTRPEVRVHQKRLMEYVERGGTYVVQYVTVQRQEAENLGPYSFNVSRERVSVEEAPVSFNDSTHPLLIAPNKITNKDFEGWVQERGLYYADKWDERYQTVLESNDPGEPPRKGGLLYAQYGKGHFIYTGYVFFRQLPAGVPGAFRLFVNLISVGK